MKSDFRKIGTHLFMPSFILFRQLGTKMAVAVMNFVASHLDVTSQSAVTSTQKTLDLLVICTNMLKFAGASTLSRLRQKLRM